MSEEHRENSDAGSVRAPQRAIVKCAICGKDADFFAPPTGPFCSTRCKLVDLGKWFGEEYKISEPLRPDHFAEYEEESGAQLDRPEGE